ncbi:YjzD family protein [Bacillus sp. AGMB 02131]|uniref:YjzD family protein n=1 Tax=Peribacillus faecalis TaxID=2772559 RepID=A0A927D3B5_9BACI|nr:YjzD family protein [Peribacillus faecalis]MBD3110324.1 YjzD family protein [Peribacillus faecalis]
MRYIVTFVWVFLLMQMVTYVVSSMNGAAYDFNIGLITAVPVTILICLLPLLIPNEPVDNGHH